MDVTIALVVGSLIAVSASALAWWQVVIARGLVDEAQRAQEIAEEAAIVAQKHAACPANDELLKVRAEMRSTQQAIKTYLDAVNDALKKDQDTLQRVASERAVNQRWVRRKEAIRAAEAGAEPDEDFVEVDDEAGAVGLPAGFAEWART